MHSVRLHLILPLLLTLLVYGVVGQGGLTEAAVKAACPSEQPYCAKKALAGSCVEDTVTAKVLRRTCACSCEHVLTGIIIEVSLDNKNISSILHSYLLN